MRRTLIDPPLPKRDSFIEELANRLGLLDEETADGEPTAEHTAVTEQMELPPCPLEDDDVLLGVDPFKACARPQRDPRGS